MFSFMLFIPTWFPFKWEKWIKVPFILQDSLIEIGTAENDFPSNLPFKIGFDYFEKERCFRISVPNLILLSFWRGNAFSE